jgi:2-polyprenyl-3-methyl-5-hydroxy-6-metoxy-1,4-benzoquinol methylase
MDRTQHWENVYQTKSSTEVSWYEPDPKQSLELILQAAGDARSRVLDVGGGQSFLVDRLLDAGFEHVAVLDISQTAIEATKARLGERASQVEWIVADITHRDSLGEFDVWHDRAVFHFVIDPEDRRRYVELLRDPCQSAATSSLELSPKAVPKSAAAYRSVNTMQPRCKKNWGHLSNLWNAAHTCTPRQQASLSSFSLASTNA